MFEQIETFDSMSFSRLTKLFRSRFKGADDSNLTDISRNSGKFDPKEGNSSRMARFARGAQDAAQKLRSGAQRATESSTNMMERARSLPPWQKMREKGAAGVLRDAYRAVTARSGSTPGSASHGVSRAAEAAGHAVQRVRESGARAASEFGRTMAQAGVARRARRWGRTGVLLVFGGIAIYGFASALPGAIVRYQLERETRGSRERQRQEADVADGEAGAGGAGLGGVWTTVTEAAAVAGTKLGEYVGQQGWVRRQGEEGSR